MSGSRDKQADFLKLSLSYCKLSPSHISGGNGIFGEYYNYLPVAVYIKVSIFVYGPEARISKLVISIAELAEAFIIC